MRWLEKTAVQVQVQAHLNTLTKVIATLSKSVYGLRYPLPPQSSFQYISMHGHNPMNPVHTKPIEIDVRRINLYFSSQSICICTCTWKKYSSCIVHDPIIKDDGLQASKEAAAGKAPLLTLPWGECLATKENSLDMAESWCSHRHRPMLSDELTIYFLLQLYDAVDHLWGDIFMTQQSAFT